jgi:hypothetical protein
VLTAADRVAYVLPGFGLRDTGGQRIFSNNLFCGIEFVH